MVMSRHEFLSQLHKLLRPKRYLEIGVQYGKSLGLAVFSELAIGVDPHPLCQSSGNQQIFPVTADDFFTYYMAPEEEIDLGFIDGSHLFEDALRDFINVEQHSHQKTVVVFDDMLPLNQDMTSRVMVPGHWTGDVWKVWETLSLFRKDLHLTLVDTDPTGTMVVWNLDKNNTDLVYRYQDLFLLSQSNTPVPDDILTRSIATQPDEVITKLEKWLTANGDI